MVRVRLVLAVLLVAIVGSAQEPQLRYHINARLDPATHRITASENVRWTNTGGAPATELWWHLYLNAFASDRTTFMRELGGRGFRSPASLRDGEWGWTRITRLELGDGTDLTPALEFVRPDDANPEDFTVARVTLPREIPAGASVDLVVDFEAQLPRVFARTGYAGDFHLVGQWFPKLGVFEGERGWNCHQFHAASEFFADFGSYRVAVTVPAGWVVGATGVEVERTTEGAGQRIVFAADRVHDFAWFAAPEALMTVVESDFEPGRDVPVQWLKRAAGLLDLSAAELELPPIHLRLILPRSQLQLAPRMVRAARLAVAWFGLHYGPYPYPQLTIVSPPITAGQAGGMEYPTFITTGASLLWAVPVLDRVPWIETVTVHEFGHQYFQGLLGSNESEQGWLDEGLTSYAEAECMRAITDHRLADLAAIGGPWERIRAQLRVARLPLSVDRDSWRFRSFSDYVVASFDKPAAALKTIERTVGEDRFARALRAYVDRYRFRHPSGEDLFAVLEESTGVELGWFFEQAFGGDAGVDWMVLRVTNRVATVPRGLAWDGRGWSPREPSDQVGSPWNASVEVGRRGEFKGPVQVLLTFADGRHERRTWDGQDRWVRWQIPTDQRLVQVVVDPDGVWALETERADNYWRDEPNRTAVRRRLWWLVDGLQLLALVHTGWS